MSRFRAAVPAVAAGILVLTVGAPGSAVADVADPSFAPLTRAEAEQRPVLRIGDEVCGCVDCIGRCACAR